MQKKLIFLVFTLFSSSVFSGVSGTPAPKDHNKPSVSGTFDYVWSATLDLKVVTLGDQSITAGSLLGTFNTFNTSGSLFKSGYSMLSDCVIYIKRTANNISLEGPCVMIDKESDSKLFVMAKRDSGNTEIGGGGEGKQKIIGGTGIYAGVKGSCDYSAKFLPENQATVFGNCSYKKT